MEIQAIRHSDKKRITLVKTFDEAAIRYVDMETDETMASLNYLLRDNTMVILHTEVAEELQGQGMAKRIVKDAIELAKKNGLKIQATCSYVRGYFERNPDTDYISSYPEI